MISRKTVNALLVSAVALTVAGAASAHDETPGSDSEKCYGVVKAGQNDCANASDTHGCGAQAQTDGDKGEFVLVAKGLCEKLVNGSLTPPPKGKKKSETPHE